MIVKRSTYLGRLFIVTLLALSGCTVSLVPVDDSGNGGDIPGDNDGSGQDLPDNDPPIIIVDLDSDADAFTDDEELANIPATDPRDPLDNPLNVHDADLDGCSDFEEIELTGFCDEDPFTADIDLVDVDFDLIPNRQDNCVNTPNFDQFDGDFDGVGDACDLCIGADDLLDFDDDGTPDDCDLCPLVASVLQGDLDGDLVGDVCDNCPFTFNPEQFDSDADGFGDDCENFFDFDDDGIPDEFDNCPFDFNPDQIDSDDNGFGDECDIIFDFDDDLVPDDVDNCILVFNPDQIDSDGDGFGDECDDFIVIETLFVAGQYADAVVELSDGSVWEFRLGPVTDWFAGDEVAATDIGLYNFDVDSEEPSDYLGQALDQQIIAQIDVDGSFVVLFDTSSWDIAVGDQNVSRFWLQGDEILVVEGPPVSYFLVNIDTGDVVEAAETP